MCVHNYCNLKVYYWKRMILLLGFFIIIKVYFYIYLLLSPIVRNTRCKVKNSIKFVPSWYCSCPTFSGLGWKEQIGLI